MGSANLTLTASQAGGLIRDMHTVAEQSGGKTWYAKIRDDGSVKTVTLFTRSSLGDLWTERVAPKQRPSATELIDALFGNQAVDEVAAGQQLLALIAQSSVAGHPAPPSLLLIDGASTIHRCGSNGHDFTSCPGPAAIAAGYDSSLDHESVHGTSFPATRSRRRFAELCVAAAWPLGDAG